MKWYQKEKWVIVLLILFFPVGLILMWKYTDWGKKSKITITTIILVIAIGGVIYSQLAFNERMQAVNQAIANEEFETAKTMLEDEMIANPQMEDVYIAYSDYYIATKQYSASVDILEQGSKKAKSDMLADKAENVKDEYANEIQEEIDRKEEEKKQREEQLKIEKEEQQKLKAESEKKEQEDYKLSCSEYRYEDLARDPEQYKDSPMVFKGKVVQVMEVGKSLTLRVNVTKGEYNIWKDTIYVDYKLNENESRILEDDIITLYGDYRGIKSYTTVLGSRVSIPHIKARFIDIQS